MSEGSNASVIVQQTTAAQMPRSVDTRKFQLVPETFKVEDLERFCLNPNRPRGTVKADSLESLTDMVNRHKNPGTVVYVHADTKARYSVVAVLNDHHPRNPVAVKVEDLPSSRLATDVERLPYLAGFGDHRVDFSPGYSEEWIRWMANNDKPKPQREFAEFIEDNLPDIVRPDGATMLEIATTLQANRQMNFKSGVRLQNGDTKIEYQEDTAATAGAVGHLEIPKDFDLLIPVFDNGPSNKVTARLRYSIESGRLTLRYQLVRPHIVIRDAVINAKLLLASRLPGVCILEGSPASALI